MTARKERVGGEISLYAARSSSQHLVGDAFQLDGEQLNPSTAGEREEEGRGKKGKKLGRRKKRKKKDENKQKEQSIHRLGLQMTRDHCLCESSQCYLRPHHRTRLYCRAEQRTLMWSKQLHASTFNPLPLTPSLLPNNDTGCGYVNPERAVKTDVGPILLIFCFR